jgi:uncharacterized protein (DUF2384 family)
MSVATQEDVQDLTRRSIGRGSTISGSAIGAMFGLGGANTFLSGMETLIAVEDNNLHVGIGHSGTSPQQIVGEARRYRSTVGRPIDFAAVFAADNVKDERANQPLRAIEQPVKESLRGRITGPVQVIRKIGEDWSLSGDELATLLAYSSGDRVVDLLTGRISLREADREDRARLIFRIYRILSRLFTNSRRQSDWLRSPNPMLRDRSPLEVMLNDRIPGMVVVLNLVDRLAGR